jgi:sterol desaturase/sphingolipid hydroxylase (fatty acid hydroxylase superfamily)
VSAPPSPREERGKPSTQDDGQSIQSVAEAARIFFGRVGPRRMAAQAAGCWAARAAQGRPRFSDALVTGAVVAWWPLQEWLVHKHVLHMKPRPGGDGPLDVYAAYHRSHHADPRDIDLTFVPDEVLRVAIPTNLAVWFVITGFDTRRAATGAAAYSTMALLYEWTHFLVHTGVKPNPRTALGRLYARIRRNHRYHHYHHEDYWLSFTWPTIDRLLGTEPDPKTIERSPTVKNLHGAL